MIFPFQENYLRFLTWIFKIFEFIDTKLRAEFCREITWNQNSYTCGISNEPTQCDFCLHSLTLIHYWWPNIQTLVTAYTILDYIIRKRQFVGLWSCLWIDNVFQRFFVYWKLRNVISSKFLNRHINPLPRDNCCNQ